MAPKSKVIRTSSPSGQRLTGAERREARVAALATEQADLKREAAERRARRAKQSSADGAAGKDPGSAS